MDPDQLENFLRQFVRYFTSLKADWIVVWEPLPPAAGLKDTDLELWTTIRDAKIQENIMQKLVLAGKEDVDESSMKAFKRTMEACACSSLRDFLGGQALAMVPSDYSEDNPLKLALERLRSHANAVLSSAFRTS